MRPCHDLQCEPWLPPRNGSLPASDDRVLGGHGGLRSHVCPLRDALPPPYDVARHVRDVPLLDDDDPLPVLTLVLLPSYG
jgi:hypothetical protein